MSSCLCESAPASCGCKEKLPGPSPDAGLMVAMATVPMQMWETPYKPSVSLRQGTVFPCLDKPLFKTGGDFLG